jgi:hypothetical protein
VGFRPEDGDSKLPWAALSSSLPSTLKMGMKLLSDFTASRSREEHSTPCVFVAKCYWITLQRTFYGNIPNIKYTRDVETAVPNEKPQRGTHNLLLTLAEGTRECISTSIFH